MDHTRYDVSVVSLSPGSAVRKLQKAGIEVLVIDEPDDAIAVGALAAYLAEERPEVIHDHMFRAETVGTRAAMALAEVGQRRPYVVSTVHSSRIRSEEDRQLLRELTPHMDQLIAVSEMIERKLIDEGRTTAPIQRIYNGVDLSRYDHQEACCTLPEEYGMEPGSQLVGVVARLEPEKGHPTLIEAWPKVLRAVPDAYLLIVGEGSRREALEAQARELKIAHRVIFTGRRDDVPAVTAALDVAVLPSYREAQGLSILEAMALSRPVVASNVGGIPEMIEDGRTGLLVEPHDADALAAGIIRLLKDHPLRRHDRPCRPRPGPRPVLRRIDGLGDPDDLRRGCRRRAPDRGRGGRIGPSARCGRAPRRRSMPPCIVPRSDRPTAPHVAGCWRSPWWAAASPCSSQLPRPTPTTALTR